MAVQPCIEWMSIKKTHLQHLIRMATFVFVLICSEALLNCHLTMSLNKETKYSYVEKCFFDQLPRNWVQWCCPGLSYFCLLPVGDILTSRRIGSFLTSTHTSLKSSEVISHTSFCLNVIKPPFLQDRACVTSNDAPQIHWVGILSSG